MPRIICPDCRRCLKGKDTITICPAGDTISRKYCEDCGLDHALILEEIRMQSYENPDPEVEEWINSNEYNKLQELVEFGDDNIFKTDMCQFRKKTL